MGRAASFEEPDLVTNGVLDRARKDNKWSQAQAQTAQEWYGRFLKVCYKYPGSVVHVMTPGADELWHTHITFTHAYRTYCESILGYYLDHNPVVPRRPPTAAEKATAQKQYSEWNIRAVLPDMMIQCHP